MAAYILRRVLWLIPVLFAVSLITFTLMKLVPGGPWDEERQVPPSVTEALNRKYGLDKPVPQQYLDFVWNAVRGDLGISYIFRDRPVTDVLLQNWPATAILGLSAFLFAVTLGVGMGTIAALRQNTPIDYIAVGFSTLGASAPSFVLGIFLIIFFGVYLRWFPTGGWGTPAHVVLPMIALGALPAAYIARLTRASILEVLGQDYVRTARAKGLRERMVVWRHVLKNSLIPVLTVLGPYAAFFLTGSFLIEQQFSIPGIGRTFVQGLSQRDYALIMGATLLYAVLLAVANLVVDIAYAFVDPRIRYS